LNPMGRKKVESYVLFSRQPTVIKPLFQGETMRCEICGVEQKSNPNVESNWSCVELGGEWRSLLLYVCPKHYLPDVLQSLVKKALERLNQP